VPKETQSPFVTSGIRVGTPALTTRGMGADEMGQVAALIDRVITAPEDDRSSPRCGPTCGRSRRGSRSTRRRRTRRATRRTAPARGAAAGTLAGAAV
jgi:glycine/serine hydroxymethyltransferase